MSVVSGQSEKHSSGLSTECCLLATDYCFRFQWIARILPGFHAADEHAHVGEIVFEQDQRRTGAGMLAVSSAVDDDDAPAWYFVNTRAQLLAPDAERSRYLHVARGPVAGVACIEEEGAPSRFDQRPGFRRADPRRLRRLRQQTDLRSGHVLDNDSAPFALLAGEYNTRESDPSTEGLVTVSPPKN